MGAPQMPLPFSPTAKGDVPGLEHFHPLVQRWFGSRLGAPSPPQLQGWPPILEGRDVLLAAPTGSGKTLAAFLVALDRLFRQALSGELGGHTHVVYVSPLKALGNDVQKNLLQPLEELYALALAEGLSPEPIRVQVRTGDTPAAERAQMVRRPPHILITTPESLYLLLTAPRARETLRRVDTVIVDEIHALARDKRGSHFSLSLERLKHLTGARPQLIGLSATVRPLPDFAAFLTGDSAADCAVVEVGHLRTWELSIETPEEELSAVATHEMWGQVYDRLVRLVAEHRTTLIFTNTRKLAERVAHDLGLRIGPGLVCAHHGSMARELRLSAEQKLKQGHLRAMVATASLELGIDIGSVDVVVQLGSPRAMAVFLQRVGRAGHHLAGVSKGLLVAFTRDELVECAALVRAVREGKLDSVHIPQAPLDVLAQQLVAACAVEPWDERALYALVRRAWPYRNLSFEAYEDVLRMLAEGVAVRGPSRMHLHRDRVHHQLKARRGARLAAVFNAGAIPDTFNYPVLAEPEGRQVGTLDEDFAVECSAGDIFLLGSTSWRIQSVRAGTVRVEDAHGAPPTVPFWRGEGLGRTEELSSEVGRLREDVSPALDVEALREACALSESGVDALLVYLRVSEGILGALPTTTTLVAERFFDEAGGMQLCLHAPFGSRINRAWGLALRKRFCRTFDFELQAAATDDGILLSLGEQHSFPLADIFDFLHPDTVEEVLVQAVLQSPLFGTRFRWNATRALALSRFQNGKRVPPQIQRARSDDLMAAVFPAQVGCQDNHGGGDVELPHHPLVSQTVEDCLREALDVDGLKAVLRRLRAGELRTLAVDLPEPSPLAHALLNSQPYTFLDDAPLEERRARAVAVRRSLPAEDARDMGALDADAIHQVILDARPLVRDADELHELLLQGVLVPEEGLETAFLQRLFATGRAARLLLPERHFVVAAERVAHALALFPQGTLVPPLAPLADDGPLDAESALLTCVRGRMEVAGPVTATGLSVALCQGVDDVTVALHALEAEGTVLRGHFRPGQGPEAELEWCDRRLLQRIHRLTVGRLRREIEPLSASDFMRFLFRWHHVSPGERFRGGGGLLRAVALLEGVEAPAAGWEQALLPARVHGEVGALLEQACWKGELAWGRLTLREPRAVGPRRGAPVDAVPLRPKTPLSRVATLSFFRRSRMDVLLAAARPELSADGEPWLPEDLEGAALDVGRALIRRGACFFQDLLTTTRRPPEEVEDALWELLARGVVSADALENLRVLQSPKRRRQQKAEKRGGPGRWTLLLPASVPSQEEKHRALADLFLQRWGIVFRDLVVREPLAPPWRVLHGLYRRMEARGELRGGRFVAGVAGEQFALPDAVDTARAIRRASSGPERVELSAVDPLNLTGIVTPGPRVPAVLGERVVYVDGVPQAVSSEVRVEAGGAAPA